MPLVNAKCTNCGADIRVDKSKEAAVCEYCGSAFIVEKAIYNYNMTNNINANTVNIYGRDSSDFQIIGGVLKKYQGASCEVVIPDTVSIIGCEAFRGCMGITSVIIPESVKKIDTLAFWGCYGLTEIIVPDSVEKLGSSVFNHCKNLSKVILSNSIDEIPDHTFYCCHQLKSVVIPNNVISIGASAFEFCDSLSQIIISDNITNVGKDAFTGCKELKIIASEDWKKKNYNVHQSLISYKPQLNKKSGCYVATAIYGSYDCPQVWTLRRYRDNTLAKTWYGKAFIMTYYAISPIMVKWFGKKNWFRNLCKPALDRMILKLNNKGYSDKPYID